MAGAFYESLGGGAFAATPATGGPWSPAFQHAGPVAGLIGRAFERHDPVLGTRVARVTLEILGPVPVAELRVDVRTVRPGKRVALLEAELSHEGRPVVRATAWRTLRAPGHVPTVVHAPAPPAFPESPTDFGAWDGAHMDGYLSAMEWRLAEGTFLGPGPGTVWARSRVPLVAGEEDSPLVRALVLSDSASGIGSQLDLAKWQIVNTDLTVSLHRDPAGGWLCLSGAVHVSGGGSGLCEGRLADASGPFGLVTQTMFVDEQPSA
ncbi:thioesterase family protein [Spirillospora albida]|uniref:thioesterase family protein n=1 Tax=Spirillospora albida TaxID=58123 RepID=UPI0004BE68A1|nr:thioesterase family protein [Spirillospora albida]